MAQKLPRALNSSSRINFSKTNTEHKRVFAELEESYEKHYASFKVVGFLCGWNWWSLPPKMWRIAKALGFENSPAAYEFGFIHEWKRDISSYSHSDVASAAQEAALEELRKKYPDSVLLQNISPRGRLD